MTDDMKAMKRMHGKRSGQTLVIAILVLGVLLILGVAFASIIKRNIDQTSQSRTRTVASDLSQAGTRFAHFQLVNSELGADWRPLPTPPIADALGLSRDPDSFYTRPASGIIVEPDPVNRPGYTLVDKGGPDYRGPFARTNTENGRRLIRVRYAPHEFSEFGYGSDSTLRQAGKAQSYIIIESIGRAGSVVTGGRIDPTVQLRTPIKVGNYVDAADLRDSLGTGRGVDLRANTESRKLVAFASIGIIESARFITNKNNSSEAAHIGLPSGGGLLPGDAGNSIVYQGAGVNVTSFMGQIFADGTGGRSLNWGPIPGGGSLFSNADLKIYGSNRVALNAFLGEAWLVNGSIIPGEPGAGLQISRYDYNPATDVWSATFNAVNTAVTPINMVGGSLDSRSSDHSTQGGTVRDGEAGVDPDGQPNGVARKDPPSILSEDPSTGLNRYKVMTQQSGPMVSGVNVGRFGYGQGVYVDAAERGNLGSEDSRRQQGAVRSLPNDWLNPNNSASLGWQGPHYTPLAAYVRLIPDGFEIFRDSRSARPFWVDPATGASTGDSRVQYRLRVIENPVGSGFREPFIINSVQQPALVAAAPGSLSDADFRTNGLPFNGVLFFEGDVRVRGVIPTDIQMSVVSMGSIYIEGSVTRGLVNANNSRGVSDGSAITTPSRSSLMLMARDYAVVNTTQFFGPAPGESPSIKSASGAPDTPSPIELDSAVNPRLTLLSEFLVDPLTAGGNPQNPSSWSPFATAYVDGGGTPIPPQLNLHVSADDGGPAFTTVDVFPQPFGGGGAGAGTMLFDRGRDLDGDTTFETIFNAADPFYAGTPATPIPILGLGDPSVNAYPRFAGLNHAFILPGDPVLGTTIATNAAVGGYGVALQDQTRLRFSFAAAGTAPAKNFLLSQALVTPHDIKIEAGIFAEEGSFYVVPGNWLNPNPNDNRDDYTAGTGDYAGIAAVDRPAHRYRTFGNLPGFPFYGESPDVRVEIVGAVSENMPAPMAHQLEWKRKWGWIPVDYAGSSLTIPTRHLPASYAGEPYVPNMLIRHDPMFYTGSSGELDVNSQLIPVRQNSDGWSLPPMPRLPVSPTLSYFGEPNP